VFNKVAIVLVVTLALVIWALADVKPVLKFNVPELISVATELVTVLFVALTEPVLILVIAKVPAVKLVTIKLVTVLFVVLPLVLTKVPIEADVMSALGLTKVPSITKSSDKLILPPINVAPTSVPVVIAVLTTFVIRALELVNPVVKFNVAEVMFVETAFVIVLFVTLPLVMVAVELTKVPNEADIMSALGLNKVPSITKSSDKLTLPALNVLATKLLIVLFWKFNVVKFNEPVLIFVATKFIAVAFVILPLVASILVR